ncbi:hypothetical protein pdam_00022800 [Pocillopora damicornis]|uniref:Uncharacterized protein n=1 Tax=Pocillopora damicornis TaxID=46731 RepID=A0A3M6T7V6_POCDA|nr:hypothetical protein pdam_00022800 [Pocillopora damicornis]
MAIADLLLTLVVIPWSISSIYTDGTWMIPGVFGNVMFLPHDVDKEIIPCKRYEHRDGVEDCHNNPLDGLWMIPGVFGKVMCKGVVYTAKSL